MANPNNEEASTEDLVHENEHTDAEPVPLSVEEMYSFDDPDPDFEKGVRKYG